MLTLTISLPCTGRNLNKSFATLQSRFYKVLRNKLQMSPHIALSDARATKS